MLKRHAALLSSVIMRKTSLLKLENVTLLFSIDEKKDIPCSWENFFDFIKLVFVVKCHTINSIVSRKLDIRNLQIIRT